MTSARPADSHPPAPGRATTHIRIHMIRLFDPDARWQGTVQTPGGLIIHQIGSDWILGTEEDEMDVEHIRMYRIQKPAA